MMTHSSCDHIDLLEFDLADTNWHVISMTTNKIDAVPGDQLNVQFRVTDFGLRQYEVDLDYYKADIVNRKQQGWIKGLLYLIIPPFLPSAPFPIILMLPMTH
jgi:hypothetical protein